MEEMRSSDQTVRSPETTSANPGSQPSIDTSSESTVLISETLQSPDNTRLKSEVKESPSIINTLHNVAINHCVYRWQDLAENLELYRPGGLHPVHLGDEYSDGRYLIVGKAGYGGYSTVWLAKDQHANHCVILKIRVADGTTGKDGKESRILRHLAKAQSQNSQQSYVLGMLDDFYIDGPNGRHLCIVSEPSDGSFGGFKDEGRGLYPFKMARLIAAQVILGLKQIHSCGVVHGDLHPKNILFRSPLIDSLSIDESYELLGEPRKTPVERIDGAPVGKEAPLYIPDYHMMVEEKSFAEPHILICDFGEAWLCDSETRDHLCTPELYRAPEAYFSKEQIGKPADIWALGCTLFETLGDRPLYLGGHYFYDRDLIISEMVSALGMLPKPWWEAWERKSDYFLHDGSWNNGYEGYESEPLLQRIQQFGRQDDPEFTAEEATSFANMLHTMFIYDPEKRATIEEVVESDWMKRWGLPALEQMAQHAKELESHMGLFVVGESCIFEL